MRILQTALLSAALLATVATPAFAHHKLNHPEIGATTAAAGAQRDPCRMVSHNPHQAPGAEAMAAHCQHLRAQLAQTPNDTALRERCNDAAMARTGIPCDHAQPAAS